MKTAASDYGHPDGNFTISGYDPDKNVYIMREITTGQEIEVPKEEIDNATKG